MTNRPLTRLRLTQDRLIILLGAAAVALMIVLILLQLGTLRDTREAVADEQVALSQKRARLEQLRELERKGPEFLERLAAVERLIPDQPQEDALLIYLSEIAERTDTSFVQARFAARVNAGGGGYVKMPLSIIFEGRYHGFLELLDGLRDGERTIRVDDVRISRGREPLPKIRADISAHTFHKN